MTKGARLLLRRLLESAVTLALIVVLSFFVIRLAPGSPFSSERAVPEEVRAELEAHYGFDKPLVTQLGLYLRRVVVGDLGMSIKYPQRSVNEIIADGLPATLAVGAVALFWALLVGIGAGVIGAARHNSLWDHAVMGSAMLGISLPTFVLGPLLILAFALTLYVLPPGGWGSLRHLILPGITLGTVRAAYIARLTRAGLLDVLSADFVRTARAKGLRESVILWRHVLRVGLTPVVTFLGPTIAEMAVGSVVVEVIFATPGIGPYVVDAAFNRDYFLIMGLVLLYSTALLAMNLLVDLCYGVLDPRVRDV